jgi:hypothetical protein
MSNTLKSTILKRLKKMPATMTPEEVFKAFYGSRREQELVIPEDVKNLKIKTNRYMTDLNVQAATKNQTVNITGEQTRFNISLNNALLHHFSLHDTACGQVTFTRVKGNNSSGRFAINIHDSDLFRLNIGSSTLDTMFIHNNKIKNDCSFDRNSMSEFTIQQNDTKDFLVTDNQYLNIEMHSNKEKVREEGQLIPIQIINDKAYYNGKDYPAIFLDGIPTGVLEHTEKDGLNIYKGFDRNGRIVWIYHLGIISVHSITKAQAREDFKFKLKHQSVSYAAMKKIADSGIITRDDYRVITGACTHGIQMFAERIGRPNDTHLTLKEITKYLKPSDYGYDKFKRFLSNLDHYSTETNYQKLLQQLEEEE